MLEEASARTEADKAAVVDMESVAMIAPSINRELSDQLCKCFIF